MWARSVNKRAEGPASLLLSLLERRGSLPTRAHIYTQFAQIEAQFHELYANLCAKHILLWRKFFLFAGYLSIFLETYVTHNILLK